LQISPIVLVRISIFFPVPGVLFHMATSMMFMDSRGQFFVKSRSELAPKSTKMERKIEEVIRRVVLIMKTRVDWRKNAKGNQIFQTFTNY
jgi:hypothetical protein